MNGRAHTIAAIRFGPRLEPASSMRCKCGWRAAKPTAEALDLAFRAHRRKVGAPSRAFSDTIRAGNAGDTPFNTRLTPARPASEWPI